MSYDEGDQSTDPPTVTVFTDTYLPTVNGVTYTIDCWRENWPASQMPIVYPASDHTPRNAEYPVPSLPFPFYDGFRAGIPQIPAEAVEDADLIHAHTGYTLGLAASRAAQRHDLPLVATYHTPISEYASYVAPRPTDRLLASGITAYERWFYNGADVVIVPSDTTADYVQTDLGVTTDVHVLSNGIDTTIFTPTDATELRRQYNLPSGPLIGYTGRHGHEKNLSVIIDALTHLDSDVTVVFGGDGPARPYLEQHANDVDADVRFLGFLDRDDLPAFYSMLDVFVFPSPIETEGLVAREAIACGTPVVGADAGALSETIADGQTGYLCSPDDATVFAAGIEDALANRDALHDACLSQRDSHSVEATLARLEDIYQTVL